MKVELDNKFHFRYLIPLVYLKVRCLVNILLKRPFVKLRFVQSL